MKDGMFNCIDVTSSTKMRGLEDLKERISIILGRTINYENVFIAGDQPKGNDRPILAVKGAYSVEYLGARKVAALIKKSIFVNPEGKLLKFDENNKLVGEKEKVSSSAEPQRRIFIFTDELVNEKLRILQNTFGLKEGQLSEFQLRVRNTFANKERLVRFIDYLLAQKKLYPHRDFVRVLTDGLRTLYVIPQAFPIYLLAMLRLYNKQKLFVIGRNSKLIKSLEILKNNKLGKIVESRLNINLPGKML